VERLYRGAVLAVIPIRGGGGTRIKLLEAAAHGVPIVATRIGAMGSGFLPEHEILIADQERDLIAACTKILMNGTFASRLASRARSKVRRQFCAKQFAERLLRIVR
jgi:glycosyltransferase involved in cell wall biosynthesis